MAKRTVVQLVASDVQSSEYEYVVPGIIALCSDGSLWQWSASWGSGWMTVPAVPEP